MYTTEERIAMLETELRFIKESLVEIKEEIRRLPGKFAETAGNMIAGHEYSCKLGKSDGKPGKPGGFEKFMLAVLTLGTAIGGAVYAYVTGGGGQ